MATDTYSDKPNRLGDTTRWLLTAAAIAVALVTLAWLSAASAQAQGGNTPTDTPPAPELPDSDNLDFNANSIGASHFGIRLYGYNAGSAQDACKGGGRADGFFSAADFPVASHTGSGSVAAGTCEAFVAQQQQAAAHMASTGGYYLAKTGSGLGLAQHQGGAAPTRYQRIPSYGASDRLSDSRVDQGDGNLFVSLDVQQQNGFGQRTIDQIPFSIRIRTDEDSASSGYVCLGGFHPRGEDSASYDTASSSGRKLNSLKTSGAINDANAHWCRSDARHPQSFPSSSSGQTLTFDSLRIRDGSLGFGETEWYVQPGTVRMWGRAGCYYTVLSIDWSTDGTSECVYPFPLPCDDDLDGRLNEGVDISNWAVGTAVGDISCTPGEQGNRDDCDPGVDPGCPPPARTCDTHPDDPDLNCDNPIPPCVSNCGPPTTPTPPPTTPPCVAHTLAVAENVVAGSNATPGLTTASQYRTGSRWNLQTVAPYPNSAAPDRETSDISGCPDGDETRLAHSNTARENAVYADSGTRPPPAADPTVDRYDPVRRNLAHQHAGAAAFADCAQKRAEAELVLAYVQAEAELYAGLLDETQGWADGWIAAMNNYSPTVSAGLGWLGDYTANVAVQMRSYYKGTSTGVDVDPSSGNEVWAGRVGYARNVKTAADLQARRLRAAAAGWTVASEAPSGSCYDNRIATLVSDFQAAAKAARDEMVGAGKPLSEWDRHTATPVSPRGYDIGATNRAAPLYGAKVFTGNVTEPTEGTDAVPAQAARPERCPDGFSEPNEEAGWAPNICLRPGRSGCPGVVYLGPPVRCGVPLLPPQSAVPAQAAVDGSPASGYCQWTRTGAAAINRELSYTPVNADGSTGPKRTIIDRGVGTATQKQTGTLNADTGDCTPGNWLQPSWVDIWTPSRNPNLGRLGAARAPSPPANAAHPTLHENYNTVSASSHQPVVLTGSYNIANTAQRAHLTSKSQADRNSVFTPAVGAVPAAAAGTAWADSDVRAKAAAYQTAYQTAYNTALSEALGDMGGSDTSTWEHTTWTYNTASLIWAGHVFPSGCSNAGGPVLAVEDLGLVTVAAPRLDFETGTANGHPLPASCNVRRTRQPSLQISYQNGHGTHTYTPASAGTGDWPLKREHDTIQLNLSLADRRPVLCWADNFEMDRQGRRTEVGVPTSAGAGLNPVGVAVRLSASRPSASVAPATATLDGTEVPFRYFNPIISNAHCGTPPNHVIAADGSGPEWVWFDDTAHSRMAHVWLAREVPDCTVDMAGSKILDLQTMAYAYLEPTGWRGPYSWETRNEAARKHPAPAWAGQPGFYGDIWAAASDFTTSGWTAAKPQNDRSLC